MVTSRYSHKSKAKPLNQIHHICECNIAKRALHQPSQESSSVHLHTTERLKLLPTINVLAPDPVAIQPPVQVQPLQYEFHR